jgi:ribonuclease HI
LTLRIFIDGACRGNPGPGSIGVYIEDEAGKPVRSHGRVLGECTNNIAEYTALAEALELAKKLGATDVRIFSDSQLLVRQYHGEYRVKNAALAEKLLGIKKRAREFQSVELTHVPREQNREADRLANAALDAARGVP